MKNSYNKVLNYSYYRSLLMEFEFSLASEKDLPRVVDIYNQIIPSRLATADLEPVTVAEREPWYHLPRLIHCGLSEIVNKK